MSHEERKMPVVIAIHTAQITFIWPKAGTIENTSANYKTYVNNKEGILKVLSQNQETAALHKRYLEGKSKRTAKKTEKKPTEAATTMLSGNLQSSVHVMRSSSGYETLTNI
ncbi:hypothetical protein GQX74_013355 [Glossina fuscipes]|nr:hypothetical protein GQX74_013355 [Glossina fuscipes]